jgi:PAS domain S-box-containing protein
VRSGTIDLAGTEPPAVPQSQSELERLFELSPDLLCVANFDGYFTRVSPSFERTLAYSSEELLSRPSLDFVHPADRARTQRAFDRRSPHDEVVRLENRCICSDGSERSLEWTIRPVANQSLIYAAARDVTDRRRVETQLRDAQRMVQASRDELLMLAEEQAALRRVATLVARGAPPDELFGAVTEEVVQLLPVECACLGRYESDDTLTVLASRTPAGVPPPFPVGARLTLEGKNVMTLVFEARRPARVDSYADCSDSIGVAIREWGIRSAVGTPIIVEGRLWGGIAAGSRREQPLPADTEARLACFTELLATAIAHAETGAALAASRARIVAAADETRRRIERDLHDGAQQRLVSLGLELRAAQAVVPPQLGELKGELSHVAETLTGVLGQLREIARGIHPAILTEGGLEPALKTLARGSPIPVELDVRTDRRLPERVEVAAYYVVSEALTNAAKHARASVVQVDVDATDSIVELVIRDDGVGGADPVQGSGLIGLNDRVDALGGTIEIASPAGRGTLLRVRIPIARG